MILAPGLVRNAPLCSPQMNLLLLITHFSCAASPAHANAAWGFLPCPCWMISSHYSDGPQALPGSLTTFLFCFVFALLCFFTPSLSSDGPLKHLFCSTYRVLPSTPQYCWNGVPRCLVSLSSLWPHHSPGTGHPVRCCFYWGPLSFLPPSEEGPCGVSQEEAVQHNSTDLDLNLGCAQIPDERFRSQCISSSAFSVPMW